MPVKDNSAGFFSFLLEFKSDLVFTGIAGTELIQQYTAVWLTQNYWIMKALTIFMFVASTCLLKAGAEDGPAEVQPVPEAQKSQIDEPALPTPERNPATSNPSLLPESNELPEHVPAGPATSHRMAITGTNENIGENSHLEAIRLQAMNDPHAAYLLKRATHSSRSATRRSFMRAYYVSVAERMRKLDPKLKSAIDEYEQEKIRELGGQEVSTHASSHRIAHRSVSRKQRYASHHPRSHHRYYQRAMAIEDPYGPYYVPYYGPPVGFYPW
jgi:hypothetical protein